MSKTKVLVNNFKLVLGLFIFWILLSEIFEAKLILIGLAASLVGAYISRDIMVLYKNEDGEEIHGMDFPVFKYINYWIWLVWQIVIASVEVAMIVLNPKLPINPQMVVFQQKMENPLAHLSLANSITLTPGTITVDIDADENYIIHSLTDAGAESFFFENDQGDMRIKIANLFGEKIEKDDR